MHMIVCTGEINGTSELPWRHFRRTVAHGLHALLPRGQFEVGLPHRQHAEVVRALVLGQMEEHAWWVCVVTPQLRVIPMELEQAEKLILVGFIF